VFGSPITRRLHASIWIALPTFTLCALLGSAPPAPRPRLSARLCALSAVSTRDMTCVYSYPTRRNSKAKQPRLASCRLWPASPRTWCSAANLAERWTFSCVLSPYFKRMSGLTFRVSRSHIRTCFCPSHYRWLCFCRFVDDLS
jgi:hypothetical protein